MGFVQNLLDLLNSCLPLLASLYPRQQQPGRWAKHEELTDGDVRWGVRVRVRVRESVRIRILIHWWCTQCSLMNSSHTCTVCPSTSLPLIFSNAFAALPRDVYPITLQIEINIFHDRTKRRPGYRRMTMVERKIIDRDVLPALLIIKRYSQGKDDDNWVNHKADGLKREEEQRVVSRNRWPG